MEKYGQRSGLWCDTSSKWVCFYLMLRYSCRCCICTLKIEQINFWPNFDLFWHFKGVSRLFEEFSWVFHGCCKVFSGKLQGPFEKVFQSIPNTYQLSFTLKIQVLFTKGKLILLYFDPGTQDTPPPTPLQEPVNGPSPSALPMCARFAWIMTSTPQPPPAARDSVWQTWSR